MQLMLLFVRNTRAGLGSGLVDRVHKAVSPRTYGCNLSALTYGAFGMRKEWRQFLDALPIAYQVLYCDEFEEDYGGMDDPLPAVFLQKDDRLEVLVSAAEIEHCLVLRELIVLLRRRLSATIEAHGWSWMHTASIPVTTSAEDASGD